MDAVPVRWRAALVRVFGHRKRGVLRSPGHQAVRSRRLFACRHCYRLAYASQQESARRRGLGKSQKIRMRLGGSPNMLEEFPDKPKGMHWRTYERWRRVHDAAEERWRSRSLQYWRRRGCHRRRNYGRLRSISGRSLRLNSDPDESEPPFSKRLTSLKLSEDGQCERRQLIAQTATPRDCCRQRD